MDEHRKYAYRHLLYWAMLEIRPISCTRGICRIDQPDKHNHGLFVRLARRGKIHSAFFSYRKHGGRESALAAAQKHYQALRIKLGEPKTPSRRFWATVQRRKGCSGILGVQKIVDRRGRKPAILWKATWSPEPYGVRRKQFSVRKQGWPSEPAKPVCGA